uniref:CCHC-type domain-containing protein n=1 Tax=Panagrolaimus superbus TaxID=310955 RepID=A0A914XV75_9BILA
MQVKREPGQSWSEFCRSHERAVGSCEFAETEDPREVVGILTLLNSIDDEALKRKLMEPENAKKSLKELYNFIRCYENTSVSYKRPLISTEINTVKSACYACGETGHRKAECKHKEARCAKCGKYGHLEKACFRKQHLVNRLDFDTVELM